MSAQRSLVEFDHRRPINVIGATPSHRDVDYSKIDWATTLAASRAIAGVT